MKDQILILPLLLLFFSVSQAQVEEPESNQQTIKFGEGSFQLGISDANLFEELMYVVPGVGSNARELLMKQDVKPFMMPVRKLGARGTTLGYSVAICLEYYVNLEKNYKVNLSPDYVSLNLEKSGRPLNAKEAFQFLAQTGTVSAAILPYDAAAITSAVYATQKYQIKNYLYLFSGLTRGRQKVFETKKALMRGNPILVDFSVNEDVGEIKETRLWKPEKPGTGLQTLIVVGYDENEEAFELMGTWGKNWGIDGYLWISYDDFGKFAQDGYVIIPQEHY